MKKYVVDIVPSNMLGPDAPKEPVYYVHLDGFPNIPVFGSIGDKANANKICRQRNIDGKLYRAY